MHPYASLMPPIIANLKRIRDALKVAKAAGEDSAEIKPPERKTRIGGKVDLGLLGIGGPQVTVTPGGGLFSSNKADAMKKDTTLKALSKKYAEELAKCAAARQAMRGPGGTTRLSDGTNAPIRRPEVSLPCPAATAAAKALSAYVARTYGGSSGGGGGGGW